MKPTTLILAVSILFLLACKEKKRASIAFMLPTFEVARYYTDSACFVKKANELGADVIVTDAANDDKKQIEQAIKLIDEGVDAIVIVSVNQTTAAAIVRYAKENNVPVIAYNRMIMNAELDFLINVDCVNFGRQMAEFAVKKKPEGNYIIISGDKSDFSAVETHIGQMEVLQPYIASGKIKIVYDMFVENWLPEVANHYMKLYFRLSSDTPSVIFSGNDGMAGGVIKELEENGLAGRVIVTGLDAELLACKRIINGSQSMTIYMPLKEQAYTAAAVAMDFVNKRVPKYDVKSFNGRVDVPTLHLKTIVVDKDNMRSTIVADGFYKESEVYGN